jgi:sodium/glucose cotransporter 1/sodium/glucose cotransporter 9
MHWIPVGASLFASNIGSGHFVGLAGSGAASGIAIAIFELSAVFVLIILGWFFVPVYVAAGVFTMPEYLRKRFGGQRIRIYLSVLALILYVFTKISADLYSGAIFLTQAMKELNLYVAIIILLGIAALFTIGGGLSLVIWTDFIQTVIMVLGAFVLMIKGFIEVGGYEELQHRFMSAYPNTTLQNMDNDSYPYRTCGIPTEYSYNMMRPSDDSDLPWPGVTFGLLISSIWYWCSDQVIVQRALAAKNLSHAKAGCILAGYLKFLPLFLIVFPGMISRVLYTDYVACADPKICQDNCNQDSCSNIAYPTLVLRLMPDGLRGLMLAVMMSALISSLTSIFNSSSTIFTMDIWRRIRKNATDVELMIVGRVCVLFLVGIGVIWIPVVQSVSELFHYIQAITSFLSPPICAVYILAVFWKRTNEQGAFWGLMVGLVVGLVRFIWEYSYSNYPCGEDGESEKPSIIKDVHYLHFGILLWGISTIVTVVISLMTQPIDDIHLERLIFWNRFSTRKRIDLEDVEEEKNPTKPAPLESTKPYEDDYDDLPWYKKCCQWICGIEKMQGQEHELTPAEKLAIEEKQTSIHEDKTWRRVLNINAILVMTVAAFTWGFFS